MSSYAHGGYVPEVIMPKRKGRVESMQTMYNLGSLGLVCVHHDPALAMQLDRLQHDTAVAQVGRAEDLLKTPKQLPKKKKIVIKRY
jgi:hypothetical protein